MDVTLTLDVNDKKAKLMYESLIHDLFDKGRADVDVKVKDNKLTFVIKSKDFTSVRATVNSALLKLRMFSELDEKLAQNKIEE
jgi:tRNA threonylcarbamoyladenosine modification (KEOPS) complex  Pcc1 subunit